MRYRDVTEAGRFRLPLSHPVLAEVVIDPVDWVRLRQLDDDNPATAILGYDDPDQGCMTVYIACASEAVRVRLEDGWG
jgi:hypothetical protein